jgi:hypothetical protein
MLIETDSNLKSKYLCEKRAKCSQILFLLVFQILNFKSKQQLVNLFIFFKKIKIKIKM